MKGVALYFYDASLTVLGHYAATGRTLTTGRCIPGRLARYHVIGRLYQREEIFGGRITAKCKGNAADTRNFKKCSPIHFKDDLPIQSRKDKKLRYQNSMVVNISCIDDLVVEWHWHNLDRNYSQFRSYK
jgi:hypothetical protein